MRRFWHATALAAVTVALATQAEAAAGPLYVFDKPGVTPDQVIGDMQGCADRAARIPSNTGAVVGTTLAGGLLAGVVTGVYQGIQRAHAMTAASDTCMYGLGYTRLDLTPEEETSFRAARSREAKQAWIRTFVGQDWSSRIATAAATQPKMLPQLPPEPFAVAGVRIDPATIKLVATSASDGQPLVTAKITRRRLATLTGAVASDRPFHVTMDAGASLYGVDGAGLSTPQQTTLWCGPGMVKVFGHDRAVTACLLDTEAGAALLPAGDSPWMMSPERIPAQVRPAPVVSGAADIALSDGDPLAPADMVLKVVGIDQVYVQLRATAQRDGKTVTVWTGDVTFGPDGRGVLPFWSKRLVLERRYDKDIDHYSVQASLEEGGSGAGWLDALDATKVAQAQGAAAGGQTP